MQRVIGARMMKEDHLWERFGTPDFALAFHVSAQTEAGKINVSEGSPYAGADTVDIIIHGVGAHGAHPPAGKDPIVLGSQIVLALQTLVSRELPPRWPGVVTVGSFHAGTKHNIISDQARLQLTVRNTSEETREILLSGIKRIAENLGRSAGLPVVAHVGQGAQDPENLLAVAVGPGLADAVGQQQLVAASRR